MATRADLLSAAELLLNSRKILLEAESPEEVHDAINFAEQAATGLRALFGPPPATAV